MKALVILLWSLHHVEYSQQYAHDVNWKHPQPKGKGALTCISIINP